MAATATKSKGSRGRPLKAELEAENARLRDVVARRVGDRVGRAIGSSFGSAMMGRGGHYSAAAPSRLRKDYRRALGSADALLGDDRLAVVAFSRNLWLVSPEYRGIIHGIVRRVVGEGVMPVGKTPGARRVAEAFIAWAQDGKGADARGLMGWGKMQRTVLTAKLVAGDVLAVRTARGAGAVERSIQLVETERLMNPDGTRGVSPDGRVVDGVERDAYGRPTRFHVAPWGPQERTPSMGDPTPVEARHAMLVAHRDRENQTRGVPLMATALDRLADVDEHWTAVNVAAKLAAVLAAVYKTPSTQAAADAVRTGYQRGSQESLSYDGTLTGSGGSVVTDLMGAEPGTIFTIGTEDSLEFKQGAQPGSNLEMYVQNLLRGICGSVGYPIEVAMGDFSRANFAVGRMAYLVADETAQMERDDLNCDFNAPTLAWFAHRAAEIGLVSEADAAEALSGGVWWQGPVMPAPDEMSAAKAAATRIENNLSDLEAETRRRGRDVEDIYTNRAAEVARAAELGITPPTTPGAKVGGEGAAGGASGGGGGGDEKDAPGSTGGQSEAESAGGANNRQG